MKVIGLTKTFTGHEFIEAAIESLYGFIDKFVFVNSGISWTGEWGNTVKPAIEKWQKVNDKENKIIHLDCNLRQQKLQYDVGYEYIRANFDCDWIMIFDSDEVWDFANLEKAKKCLHTATMYNAIGSKMHTYIKSPFYRVVPPEMCIPTVFIRPIHYTLQGIRGNGVAPRFVPEDLYFHHFTYVRFKEEDVFKKIHTSLLGDQEDVPQTQLVDIEKWKREKWDKMPRAYNFHTTKSFEKSWHRLKTVRLEDLPESVRDKEIIRRAS